MQILSKIHNIFLYIISLKGWRNLFSFSSLLKILMMYCVIMMGIFLIYIDIPKDFSDDKIKKRITVYGNMERMGEYQIFKRTIYGCRNLQDMRCIEVALPEYWISIWPTRHFFENTIHIVNLFYKTDFNLLTTHFLPLIPNGFNIFYINVPYDMIMGLDNNFYKFLSFLDKADAFLDLNKLSTGDDYFLKQAIKNAGSNAEVIPGILIIQQNEYEFSEPKELVLSGSLWGASRGSLRLSEALRKLGNEGRLFSYGPKKYLGHLENGYVDIHDFVQLNSEYIIPLHKKHGISIVAHNFDHLVGEVPTTRISESIAAGTIVISDRHPFIEKHFGDNILYFDVFKGYNEIYNEISDHLEWIKNHPDEVRKKTKNAHKILMDNFSTEVQLPQIYDNVMNVM